MTRVLTQIDFYNARPGIWNLTADFRPEDVPILTGLEFYELGELIDCANARCMRQKLEKTFIYMEGAFLGPQSFIPLLDEFRFLKIDEEGEPVMTWANTYGYTIQGEPPIGRDDSLTQIYVTKRFGDAVLSLVSQGIVKTELEVMPTGAHCAGRNMDEPQLIGHTEDGIKKLIIDLESGGMNYKTYSYEEYKEVDKVAAAGAFGLDPPETPSDEDDAGEGGSPKDPRS